MSEHRWPVYIDAETIKRFSQLNPLRSTLAIIADWSIIILAIGFTHFYFNPLTYILAIMIIGARQHALGILGHDAAHHMLYKNKTLNDVVGCFLLSWPIYFNLHNYRRRHLDHHSYLNTRKDPDYIKKFSFPLEKKYSPFIFGVPFGLGILFFLVNLHKLYKYNLNPLEKGVSRYENLFKVTFICYHIILYSILTYFKLWEAYLLFWLIPLLVWGIFVTRVRILIEHSGIYRHSKQFHTRIIYTNIFDKLFLTAHNMNYHFTHHVYPTVPWYNLKKLHSLLLKNEHYRNDIIVSHDCFAALKEIFVKPILPK